MSVRIVREVSNGFVEETGNDQSRVPIMNIIASKLKKSEFFLKESFLVYFLVLGCIGPAQVMAYLIDLTCSFPSPTLRAIHICLSQLMISGQGIIIDFSTFHFVSVFCYFLEYCIVASWSFVDIPYPLLVTSATASFLGYAICVSYFWTKSFAFTCVV